MYLSSCPPGCTHVIAIKSSSNPIPITRMHCLRPCALPKPSPEMQITAFHCSFTHSPYCRRQSPAPNKFTAWFSARKTLRRSCLNRHQHQTEKDCYVPRGTKYKNKHRVRGKRINQCEYWVYSDFCDRT